MKITARVDKVVITYSQQCAPRRKPKEGDRKTVKGQEFVRKQCRDSTGAGYVQHGRPVFEWVKV